MSKHDHIEAQKLNELEAEWNQLLPRCLDECARGRWGLFSQNPSGFPAWPEAERLRSLAQEITDIRGKFGSANPVCELFLHYYSLRHGSNVRGEPKLAAEFLAELEEQDG